MKITFLYCLSKILKFIFFWKYYKISAIALSQNESDQKKQLKIEFVRAYVLFV